MVANDVSKELSYTEAIAEGLVQAMETDERVFLLGEGVDNITGVYGTVRPAYEKFGPARVIDTPLSENGLTGIAIGAALDGLRPVLFHQRNDFMMLAMDQMVNHAAKLRYVSAGKHRIPLSIVSFVARKVGEGVQHTQSLQALFAHIPGLKVVMPTTPHNAKGLLLSAIADDDPVIVLYHRSLFEERGSVPSVQYHGSIGRAEIRCFGRDVTIVAISAAIKDALAAAQNLAEQVSVEVIDLQSIRPWDKGVIVDSVVRTGRLLVVDTGWKSFGVSAEIVASVVEVAHASLKAAPRRIGMVETPAPATPYLLKNYHPTVDGIIYTIREMMGC